VMTDNEAHRGLSNASLVGLSGDRPRIHCGPAAPSPCVA
jgi:hypothetical protein